MPTPPSVSVVIPTRARPALVVRALASALAQTRPDLEVVVVVDGPDPVTVAAVEAVGDPRVRVVVADPPVGAGGARNRGVAVATAPWVAFLDDDDVWLPEKLERQLASIDAAGVPDPIAFCPILIRSANGLQAWRSRPPAPDEHVSEYLFVRRSLRTGEGTVGTSTIMARRALLEAVPFDPTLRRYQDADWILRAAAAGARLVYCPDRLSVWTAPDERATITGAHAGDWRHALAWIRARRPLVTGRAYAAFVLVRVAALADAAGEREAAGELWREARRVGRPGLMEVGLFVGRWILPGRLRARLRLRLVGLRPPVRSA